MGFKQLFHRKPSRKSTDDSTSVTSPQPQPQPQLTPSSVKPPPPQTQELEQVFKKFDANGDGKISATELGSIMSNLGHPTSNEELEKMIREFDADGDGFVDLSEFIEMNTRGLDSKEEMENLREAFGVYDLDGNGRISAEELHKVMGSLGEECSIGECRKMISGVDSDGDGTIDFEEFKVMMMAGSRLDSFDATPAGAAF